MNINKIKLSGTTYNIQDENACKVVELTQAEYDALPATAKTSNSLFVITDATAGDLSNYYTKSETSGATEISTALASKSDTATTYTKTEVDNAITAATSTKQDTLVSGTNIKTINNESILGSGNITIEGGGSSYTAGDGIDITNDVISVTGKVDTTAFTAHTADTVIHVTSAEKTAWNAKSDFSGDYNDLTNKPTIPTVPTSNTAFTNDAGYITSDAISGKADTSAVTESINAAVSGKVDTTTYNTYTAATDTAIAGKQDTLVSGTNIKTINNESILGSGNITIEGGGGKAVAAGTNISITTGENADTINCTLSGGTLINISNNKINCSAPIRYGTGNGGVIVGSSVSTNKASGRDSIANGGDANTASGQNSYAEGYGTKATKVSSHSEGWFTQASGDYSHAEGNHTNTTNESEHSSGRYNNSVSASTTFGDSGNTLFSVGNGTSSSARHNAFEIRQNGDIYISSGGTDIKLQDHLGGGGSSYTAGDGIDITNDVISVSGVVMSSAITTSISSSSTDAQVPSAKAVYDMVGNINTILESI